ncbi:MAG: flagellar biosynthesis protein FlhF [Myxococcaceae bacterium]
MSAMVKTFRARDARSALAAVKAALGPDAVILSTQEVSGGLFRKAEIEVTAALDPGTPARQSVARAPRSTPEPAPVRHGAARYAVTPPPAPDDAPGPSLIAEELIALRSAVENVRSQLKQQALTAPAEDVRFPAPVMELFDHLIARGLDEGLAEDLLRLAAGAHGTQPALMWRAVRELLAERLIPSRAPWMPGPRRAIALIGPTGVGKTTTLAKIAARALMESRLKVALITVDTYRIGAAEQVARYGSMMNVPTRVAHTEKELARALEFSRTADLVLIDTAGRSKPDDIARQAQLLRSAPGVDLYLCLSAATGAREVAAAAARYAPLKPSRLIFTKLDEADGPASLVSALGPVGRPIVCVTDGQRVPEDIHALTANELVGLVAGDLKLGRG